MGRINRVATQIHSADARRLVAGTIIPSFCNLKDTSDTTRNSFAPALGNPFTPHRTAFITPPKALCKSVVAKLLFYLIGFFQNITLFFGCQEFFAKKSKNFSNASFGLKTRKTVQTVCMKKISTVLLCLLLLAPLHFSQISRHSSAESAARPSSEISRCAADEAVKEIFLTFDDGPTDSVTPKVLDILAEEKVKATFFVTGRQIKGREKIIERIANEGHILGIHTFTHEYAKIYASSSSLLRDIEKDTVDFGPNFDETKKYPTLLFCEGGPQSPVSQFWSYRWNMQIMAANGYVVIAPNRRGLPGFGNEWNEQISGDWTGQCMNDLLTAIDDACDNLPFVDKDRLGAVGASFGGFSVYYLAGHHDKRFKCFIAHDGAFNLESMYTDTEEAWFSNWEYDDAYWNKDQTENACRTYANSPHKFIDKWDTPILCIHGEKDYRINANQGMGAFNAARMRGIPAELLLFPDENHWVLKPQNGILWQRTFFNWLDQWLK